MCKVTLSLLLFHAAVVSAGTAQAPRTLKLPGTSADLRIAFMSGTEALVLDRQSGEVVRLRTATGTTQAFARRGAGPGEYRRITSMLQLTADTVVLWDAELRRLLTVTARQPPAVLATGGLPGAFNVQLVGRCADGGVASAAALPASELDTLPSLGLFCLRDGAWTPFGADVELRARPLALVERARNGVRARFIVPRAFASEDQVVVRPDGTILVASATRRTAEHRGADGALRRQVAVRVPPSRVSAADTDTATSWRGQGLTEGEEKSWLVPSGGIALADGSLLVTVQPADGRSTVRVVQLTPSLELREMPLAPGSRVVGWDVRGKQIVTAREDGDDVLLAWVDGRFRAGGGIAR